MLDVWDDEVTEALYEELEVHETDEHTIIDEEVEESRICGLDLRYKFSDF